MATAVSKYFSQEAAVKAGMDPTRFPQTKEEIQQAEEVIATELNKLSLDQHEQILLDIYGLLVSTAAATTTNAKTNATTTTKAPCSTVTTTRDNSSGIGPKVCDIEHDWDVDVTRNKVEHDSEKNTTNGKFLLEKLQEMERTLDTLIRTKSFSTISTCFAYHRAKYWEECIHNDNNDDDDVKKTKRNDIDGPTITYLSSLRLACLRVEQFNVLAASKLFLHHLEQKQELFGGGICGTNGKLLTEPIRLQNLTREELDILKMGHMQLLPKRDAGGRAVFVYHCRSYPNLTALARCHWYFLNACLEDDIESQTNGVVVVVFLSESIAGTNAGGDDVTWKQRDSPWSMISHTSPIDFRTIQRIHNVRAGIPERIVSVHICCHGNCKSSYFVRAFVTGIQLFLNARALPRVRTHFGASWEEIYLALQSYGIETDSCPIMKDKGSWSVEHHLDWLRRQAIKEQLQQATGECSTNNRVPRRFDVLFGRNKSIRNHTGNLRALHLVEMYQRIYDTSNKYQKMEITDRIVAIIQESQGRFLRWDDASCDWIQVDHDAAREKISHYFRHMRSKIRL